MKAIRDNPNIKIVMADKNLGPCAMTTEDHNKEIWKTHLRHKERYQSLSEEEATIRMKTNLQKYQTLMEDAFVDGNLPDHKDSFFFAHWEENKFKIPCAYLTMKIHKKPIKSRLIIDIKNRFMSTLSRWADYYLQMVLKLIPQKLRDSQDLLNRLKAKSPFPPGTKIFTYDVEAMYDHIQLTDAIIVIQFWLNHFKEELPKNFYNHDLLLKTLELIMSENVFQYNDMYFLQKIGIAMGTNVAPPYAELYYAYHEFKILFPKYPEIQLLTRFIDDGFVAWYNKNNPFNQNWKTDERFNSFVADLSFNTLMFTNTLPTDKQIFMDLEITLTRGVVSSRTYEKPLALH